MPSTHTLNFTLEPDNLGALANLCGQLNEHLLLIEERTGMEVLHRGNHFQILGSEAESEKIKLMLQQLFQDASSGTELTPAHIHLALKATGIESRQNNSTPYDRDVTIRTRKMQIRPRSDNQKRYVESVQRLDINFGIGPAGTGKTYLAVACAVEALEREEVSRILLVRPAVEAGEKLGFLPGDLSQKVDPYLRPLYDALYEMIGIEKVARLIEKNVIEIAPLAYMRGRTLNGSFVILDESQNTTREQMKMFLTRIGFGSTAVITGDVTQIDLPKGVRSGLVHAIEVLKGVEGIGFTHFTAKDVVRHPLVQHIVIAYDRYEKMEAQRQQSDQQTREKR